MPVRSRRRDGPLARARACPPGHRRATSQVGWLEDVREHPDLQLLRGDAQANVLAVAGVLAGFMDWECSTSRPTWAVLIERTELSRRSVARHLAWLRAAGLLGIVEHGTTPALSPGVLQVGPDGELAAGTGNTASVYLLIAPTTLRLVAVQRPEDVGVEWEDAGPVDAVEAAAWPRSDGSDPAGDVGQQVVPVLESAPVNPARRFLCRVPVDVSGTPSRSRRELDPHVRARQIRNLHDPQLIDQNSSWPSAQRPATKQERAAAALEARRRVPDLARLSTPYVAALCREWFLAGWTLNDVLAALTRPPEGQPHRHTARVHHVPAWFRSRLAHWRTDPADPTAPPGHSPTARATAARTHEVALRAARAARAAAVLAAHEPTQPDGAAETHSGETGAADAARRGVAALRAAVRARATAATAATAAVPGAFVDGSL